MKVSNISYVIAISLMALFIHQASSADLECCACSGTGEDASNGCGSGMKFSKDGSGVRNITCASGGCAKLTTELNGVKTFTRSCGAGTSGSTCAGSGGAYICTDTCTTAFCNDSPAVRYTALSLVSALAAFCYLKK